MERSIAIAIKFFDMFAGIGGFRSGLERCGGYECVGFCEIDKHTEKAYRAIYNTENEAFYNDITKINTDEMPDFDLLTGGFPCQPYSAAGAERGFDDPRGALFFELARILKGKRPRCFLFENVPRLLTHDGGRTFHRILCTLSELGYRIEWSVLDSAAFGVPQTRKRVYLVGYRGGECAGTVFPLGGSDEENNVGAADKSAEEYHFIDMNPAPQITETARCLVSRYDAGVSNHKGERSGILVASDAPRAVLTPDRETIRRQGRRMKEPNEPAFTVTCCDRHGVAYDGRVRKLMPLECWLLQGFTAEQFGRAVAAGIPESQLYKMAENVVSVPVIEAVGERMKQLFD